MVKRREENQNSSVRSRLATSRSTDLGFVDGLQRLRKSQVRARRLIVALGRRRDVALRRDDVHWRIWHGGRVEGKRSACLPPACAATAEGNAMVMTATCLLSHGVDAHPFTTIGNSAPRFDCRGQLFA